MGGEGKIPKDMDAILRSITTTGPVREGEDLTNIDKTIMGSAIMPQKPKKETHSR